MYPHCGHTTSELTQFSSSGRQSWQPVVRLVS